jgi:sugar lactone lactonase YvrE
MSERAIRTAVAGVAFSLLVGACGGGADAASPTAGVSPSARSTSATDVSLGAPEDVAFDGEGNLYVSEFSGNQVDVIAPEGVIAALAGTGSAGYWGDGASAIDAELSAPTGLAFDDAGDLVIVDHHNGCIRTVAATGRIERLWGDCGSVGFSGDGGAARDAQMNDPIGIAFDGEGRAWIADELNGRIRRVNVDGSIETIVGGGSVHPGDAARPVPGTKLALSHPSYIAIDDVGNVYFSDFVENVVMRIASSGRVTRVAGTGEGGYSGDGRPATEAELSFPTGLALDGSGNLYISDSDNHRIRMLNGEGNITTVAGTGEAGFAGDGGPAVDAQLQAPAGLAFDPGGELVIADQGNNLVRKVDHAGVITTIAGVAP